MTYQDNVEFAQSPGAAAADDADKDANTSHRDHQLRHRDGRILQNETGRICGMNLQPNSQA